MGDVLGSVVSGAESLGSSALSGIEGLGGDLMSGIGSLGSGLGGLFGGGSGAGAGGASAAAPSLGPIAAPVTTAATPALPTGGASAASIASSLPTDASGISAPPPSITSGIPLTNTPAGGGDPISTATPNVPMGGSGGAGGGLGGILHGLLSNPKELAGGAGIILDLLKSGQAPPGSGALSTLAGTDAGLAKSYAAQAQAEGQGILPQGAKELIQNDLNSKIAGIQQKYAQMGMAGSSAEQQDIAAARSAALAQTFEIGQSMASQGLQEVTSASGQEAQLLQQIMGAEINQNTALGQALASFAGAGTDAVAPKAT